MKTIETHIHINWFIFWDDLEIIKYVEKYLKERYHVDVRCIIEHRHVFVRGEPDQIMILELADFGKDLRKDSGKKVSDILATFEVRPDP